MRRAITMASDLLSVGEPTTLSVRSGMSRMPSEGAHRCEGGERICRAPGPFRCRPASLESAGVQQPGQVLHNRIAAFPSHLEGMAPFFHCPAITHRPQVTVNRFSASEGLTTQVPSGRR